ncbi:MAG: hypothetical protein JXA15_05900 [Spirochaetales bacterium]|nr:hypothetical protein [Spirochaetales bacterium]
MNDLMEDQMEILGLPWWAWLLIVAGLAVFVPLKIALTKRFLSGKTGKGKPELDD